MMAKNRAELQTLFEAILGSRNVYFQPPESLKMKYPCIRYELAKHDRVFANGKGYIHKTTYTVTLIDTDPESRFCELLEDIEYSSFDRPYASEGLYHYVYTISI